MHSRGERAKMAHDAARESRQITASQSYVRPVESGAAVVLRNEEYAVFRASSATDTIEIEFNS